jgi:hypothetical protein
MAAISACTSPGIQIGGGAAGGGGTAASGSGAIGSRAGAATGGWTVAGLVAEGWTGVVCAGAPASGTKLAAASAIVFQVLINCLPRIFRKARPTVPHLGLTSDERERPVRESRESPNFGERSLNRVVLQVGPWRVGGIEETRG